MKVSTCSNRSILSPCNLEHFEYQIEPYVGCAHQCHYCYALNDAETDWAQEILIYEDLAGQLNTELDSISPQKIYMGYYTDPYQPCEAEYHQTRKVLELLHSKHFSVSILTKSDLVLRDIDLLSQMHDAAVSVSIAFNDNSVRRKFEANTIDTERRILALGRLKEAGIKTSALLCPVIPYCTDVTSLVDMLAPYADKIWVYGLSVRDRSDRNWQNVKDVLKSEFNNLKEKIESVALTKDHAYWIQLRNTLLEIREERQMNLSIHF